MDNLHGKKFMPGRPIASVPDLPTVKISLVEGGTLPQKANPGDACYDCYVRELPKAKDYEVGTGMFKIPLGFKLDIPPGWKAMLWGRSGLACQGAHIHIGTIDHGYKQEVCCITNKLGWSMGGAGPSYRVCQMSFEKVHEVNLLEVDDIDSSGSRGGFGSTGMDKLQILIAQAEKLEYQPEDLNFYDLEVSLTRLSKTIAEDNLNKGWSLTEPIDWHRDPYKIPAILMLISSELSEALEAFRKDDKENFQEEMADVFIRLLDLCEGLDINLAEQTKMKILKDRSRPHRHGGKKL